MSKIKEFFKKKSTKLMLVAASAMAMLTCFAAAEEGTGGSGNTSGTSTITSALTSSMESVSSDVMGIISAVLPYALTIVGAGLVVTLGIKIFKKVAGKA